MDGPATRSAPVAPPTLIPPTLIPPNLVSPTLISAASVSPASVSPTSMSATGVHTPHEVPRGADKSPPGTEPLQSAPAESAGERISDVAAHERAVAWPNALVAEAMSRPVLTIDVTESLWDAWQLLSISGLRHLAVVAEDKCVGIISDRNILSDVPVSQERMLARAVGEVVSPGTNRSVSEGDHLAQVARMMARHSLEAVPVVGPSRNIVGIVTGSDLVRWWADDGS